MQFPSYMLSQRRWMVRPTSSARAKLPQSPLPKCPPEFSGDREKWRFAWADPAVWGSIEEAIDCWVEDDDMAGLCYVLHPAGDSGKARRLICLDFDGALDPGLDPAVESLLNRLNTYAEVSISGRGVHAFIFVECEPFRNMLKVPIGEVTVDVLCSSQVAVTGQIYQHPSTNAGEINQVNACILQELGELRPVTENRDCPDFWSAPNDGIRSDHEYMIRHMEEHDPCIEGRGGDMQMYKAACHLARHGVTGWDAVNLLALVDQRPAFSTEELQHKVEQAWGAVQSDEEFGIQGLDCFDKLPEPQGDYGFTPIRLSDLSVQDLTLEYVVEGLLIDKEGLFIGGREKCFKTSIAADLAMSLSALDGMFLGRFPVLGERKKVSFFTAEIGLRSAKALFERIAQAKGVNLGNVDNVDVIDKLPSFQLTRDGKPADPAGLDGLKRYFRERKPDVAIFDPLYLAVIGTTVGDMYSMGGVLSKMDAMCREADIWPIFCHHAKKDATKEYQPMALSDLYGAGVAAFARQWLLMSHAEPYEQGKATLLCRAGGSAVGDAGLWRVEIDEGIGDAIANRRWDVTVTNEDEQTESPAIRESVLQALRYFGSIPESVKSIAIYANVNELVARDVLVTLVHDGEADMKSGKFFIRD